MRVRSETDQLPRGKLHALTEKMKYRMRKIGMTVKGKAGGAGQFKDHLAETSVDLRIV